MTPQRSRGVWPDPMVTASPAVAGPDLQASGATIGPSPTSSSSTSNNIATTVRSSLLAFALLPSRNGCQDSATVTPSDSSKADTTRSAAPVSELAPRDPRNSYQPGSAR